MTLETPKDAKPKVKVYELQKFCHLLVTGNSHALELIFAPQQDGIFQSWWIEDFEELRNLRKSLLNFYSISKYLGQAQAHFPKKVRTVYSARNPLDEMIRILFEARNILEGEGSPKVVLDEDDRDYIIRYKEGLVTNEQLLQDAKELLERLNKKKEQLEVVKTDDEAIKDWMYRLRKKLLYQELGQS